MAILSSLVLLSTIALTSGQPPCFHKELGMSSEMCQKCGVGNLDDFCIKLPGACDTWVPNYASYNSVNLGYGTRGGIGTLPPLGYLTSGAPPDSCKALIAAAKLIPNVNLDTGTMPVYLKAGIYYSPSLPGVYFNPLVADILRVQQPLHNCLENKAPWPNGVWNIPRNIPRVDSFFYEDKGNSTWSYQCYCDFCHSCQMCTNG